MTINLEFNQGQRQLPTKRIISSPITSLCLKQQVKTMLRWAYKRESKAVCVANVHMLMEAYWNPDFATVLEKADLVTPDGMPLVWMMRILGASEQDRVAGMDLLNGLCALAQDRGVSSYFVGSHREILKRMRIRLEHEFPLLKIAGMEPLPFRDLTESEDRALVSKINASGAGLVFVALGCPKQEHWIAKHKGQIKAVMIGVGAVFPVYAGIHKRAPRWLRESGGEWLYRLMQEPKRLWNRYRKTIPPFLYLALKQLIVEKYPRHYQFSVPTYSTAPLAQVLQRAGLISVSQIEEVLQAQAQNPELGFGELVIRKGWLSAKTINFFADKLPKLARNKYKKSLPQYLSWAGILSDSQISQILSRQNKNGLQFEEVALKEGLLKQETIDFFGEYLGLTLAVICNHEEKLQIR